MWSNAKNLKLAAQRIDRAFYPFEMRPIARISAALQRRLLKNSKTSGSLLVSCSEIHSDPEPKTSEPKMKIQIHGKKLVSLLARFKEEHTNNTGRDVRSGIQLKRLL